MTATILISILLVAALAFALWRVVRQTKNGECPGGCAGCPHSCAHHKP